MTIIFDTNEDEETLLVFSCTCEHSGRGRRITIQNIPIVPIRKSLYLTNDKTQYLTNAKTTTPILLIQHGEEKLQSMLKATTGDYSGVAKTYQEDVFITGDYSNQDLLCH